MVESSAWISAAAVATVIAATVSAGVAYLVARYQARNTAVRERHGRQSELSVEVSKLLLDNEISATASRRFAVAVVKIILSPDDEKKGLVFFIPYNSRVTIGRDLENDIVLSALAMSRFHCGLISHGASVFLEDYCSTNGIMINGKVLNSGSERRLRNADIIELCGYKMRFQIVHHSEVLSR